MFRRGFHLRASCIAALALLFVCADPAAAAGYLRFRNDTPVTLIIHAVPANNPNKRVILKLFPREVNGIPVLQPGDKIIAIYNQQLQPLSRQIPVTVGQTGLFFSLRVQGNTVILQPIK
jgi:hypothetical protein